MLYERRWLAVAAVGLSIFLSALDATIVALALPPIAQHFHLSNSLASTVTLSYAIPLTLLILPIGGQLVASAPSPLFSSRYWDSAWEVSCVAWQPVSRC